MADTDQHDEVESSADRTAAVEFGASLREIRLAHQRELSAVSEDLRIRQVFLRAIEDGRFEDLPGPTYAIGFVRAYADYLGLDVAEVVERFKKMGIGSGRQPNLVPPSPVVEGRLPTGSILLVAAMLAAGAYGGWYYLSLDGRADTNGIVALPQRIAALVGMSSEPEAPPPPAKPKQAEPTEPTAHQPAVTTAEPASEPAAEPAADSAAAPEQTEQPAPADIDSAASAPAPDQGDAGLTATEPEAAPAPAPEESVAAANSPATEAPTETPVETPVEQPVPTAASTPEPQPEAAPTAPTAPETAATPEPAPAPVQTASIPEPTPAPPPAPVTEPAAETTAPEPAAVPEPAPVQAAETAAASAPIAKIAPASGSPPPAPASATESTAIPAAVPTTVPAAVKIETPSSSAPAEESAAPAAPQTAFIAPAPKARPSPPATEPQVRVTLRATTNAWVEVRERNRKTVFSRLMLSGEAVDLPVSPGMTLSTGNAGGIEILLDGTALPPLGPSGEVVRDVALDAASLRRSTGSAR
ncbi:MAG: RodZ domain-containing protein [Alphaproteobacteria bacterium]